MEPLISDLQVASLREIAERGLKDDVTIYKRGRVSDDSDPANVYGDDAETWVAQVPTVKGWVFSTPTPTLSTSMSRMVLLNTYRLFLPVGTNVTSGDQVEIRGQRYVVSDTIEESSWLPILRCSLRRAE